MSTRAFDDGELRELAAAHGTPLFLYREAVARAAWEGLAAVLPARARLAYAVKANPLVDLLRLFESLGACFDCASIGELNALAGIGIDGFRIFFAGPGKRREEIERALVLGARLQAESLEDLAHADACARRAGKAERMELNLRVHPAGGISEANRIIGGAGPSAFGIDEEELEQTVRKARDLRHVRVSGLHVFAASNERDAETLLRTHAAVFRIGARLQELLGEPLGQIDLGGGLGVPYADDEAPLDIERLGRGLTDLLRANPWFVGELILEPGRFLAAGCGIYLARVVRVKTSRGTRFVILDGGINHLIRPLLTGQPFPVHVVGRSGRASPATLTGPLCTSLDRLGDVMLPEVLAGDLVCFGMAGAYGFTEGMTHFLSHAVPQQVWVAG